jgi:catechol 2,3-dioxygenase-like lactoylglutathione lyase family enzyme
MLSDSQAFSGFAVDDIERARTFYTDVLGLRVTDVEGMDGLLTLHLPTGADVLVYIKSDHTPATFTVLNFPVADIDAAVDALVAKGVTIERYDELPADDKGIVRGKPNVTWFRDPSGNILSVLQQS